MTDKKDPTPIVKPKPKSKKNYYFPNEVVEELIINYQKTGCIDKEFRDQKMYYAGLIIENIIRAHNLHNIYPGRDEASFGDLNQVAWVQIEKSLHKFDASAGHTKVFNMMSQIAKTTILAHIKRENRDKKNSRAYKSHLSIKRGGAKDAVIERFLKEARGLCKYNDEYLTLIDNLEDIYDTDEKPYDGLIGKLIEKSGMSRVKIHQFLIAVRTRAFEFTDSPQNSHIKKLITPNSRPSKKSDDSEDD